MRLSVSSVQTHDGCPLRWKWQQQGVPATRERHIGWRRGSTVHSAMEAVYRHVQTTGWTGPLHHGSIVDVALKALTAAAADNQLPPADLDDCTDQVLNHLVDVNRVSPDSILDVEGFLQFVIRYKTAERPGLQVVAYLDRVERADDGALRIVDIKARTTDVDAGQLADDLQRQVYTVAALKRWPWAQTVEFVLHFTRDGGWVPVRASRGEVAWMEEALRTRLLASEQAMLEGPWPPTPSESACGTCPFKPSCPAHGGVPGTLLAPDGQPWPEDTYDPRMDGRNWRTA